VNPPRESSESQSDDPGEPRSRAGGDGGRHTARGRRRFWRALGRGWTSSGWARGDRAIDGSDGGLRQGLVFLLALTAAGPLLGLLWAAISPRLDVAAGISGSETAFSTQADIDATFGFICLGTGLIAGVAARWRAADGGWPVPVGIAAGGVAGSLLAGWIGHLVRSPGALRQLPPHAPAYVAGLVDFKVRATGLYMVLPATALVVLAVALWLPAALTRRGAPGEPADAPAAPDETFAAAAAFRPKPAPAETGGATPAAYPPDRSPPADDTPADGPPADAVGRANGTHGAVGENGVARANGVPESMTGGHPPRRNGLTASGGTASAPAGATFAAPPARGPAVPGELD